MDCPSVSEYRAVGTCAQSLPHDLLRFADHQAWKIGCVRRQIRDSSNFEGNPMQISTTFRDMPSNPSLQAAAERWVARLETVCDRIVACHVTIEKPHRHHLHGTPFQVHIVLTVPGANIAVSNQVNVDAYVALADAFRAARRKLLDHVALQRGFVRAPAGGSQAGILANKQ